METHPGKEKAGRLVLHRLVRYAEKVFGLSTDVLAPITDTRPQARTPTTPGAEICPGDVLGALGKPQCPS